MRKILLSIAIVITVIVGAGYGCWRYAFPYGWSHACDKILYNVLREYAERNDGWFPRGGATPEASLSVLYPTLYAETLHGKSCPIDATRARLQAGLPLTPETCGWHYVEGLRLDDDPKLALFWDKVGLGHNGGRAGGVKTVWFVDGDRRPVAPDQWQKFIADQEQLRKAIDRTKPKIPPPQKGK